MELLVAYQKDPAGHNIAKFISQKLKKDGNVYRGKDFDLVIISSPVFSADCLETVEEIGEENRSHFMSAGGESYSYIPALNDREDHINCLTQMIINKGEELKT